MSDAERESRAPGEAGSAADQEIQMEKESYPKRDASARPKGAPFFRLFSKDWWMMTKHLKAAERGILDSLLVEMHDKERPLDEDPARLARLCGASKAALAKTLEVLAADGSIVRKWGGLWSPYIAAEIEHRQKISQTSAKNISARYGKTKQNQYPKSTGVDQITDNRVQTASGGGQNPPPPAEQQRSSSIESTAEQAHRDGLEDHPRAVKGQKILHDILGACEVTEPYSNLIVVITADGAEYELRDEGGEIALASAPFESSDDCPF